MRVVFTDPAIMLAYHHSIYPEGEKVHTHTHTHTEVYKVNVFLATIPKMFCSIIVKFHCCEPNSLEALFEMPLLILRKSF